MKVDTIYRLVYSSSDKNYEGDFYTEKQEAINGLETIKQVVEELYEDTGEYPIDSYIYLQAININDLEDLDFYEDYDEIISEWELDEEYTEDYRKDRLEEGEVSTEEFYEWRDRI